MNWIKVRDQLPEINKPILFFGAMHKNYDGPAKIRFGILDETFTFVFGDHDGEYCNVCEATHWMNLPEAPNDLG